MGRPEVTMRRPVGLLLLLALACHREPSSDGRTTDDADADADADSDTDADSDADADTAPPSSGDTGRAPGCVDLAGTLGLQSGDTTGQPDDLAPTCATGGAGDQVVGFVAATTGLHRFRLARAPGIDAALAVLDGCAGPELGCAVTTEGDAVVLASLTAGRTVEVVIDGVGGDEGPWELEILEVPPTEGSCDDLDDADLDGRVDCLDPDCGADPTCQPTCPDDLLREGVPLAGSTVGALDDVLPSCGPALAVGSDRTYAFVAPRDGRWRFAAESADFLPALVLLEGCAGSELDCEAGAEPDVRRTMRAGEELLVVVDSADGGSGDFELTVTAVTREDCANGLDDDVDGVLDCDDPDCLGGADCPEDCANGLDDDVDGEPDCGDLDCALDAACPETCPELVLAAAPLSLDLGTFANHHAGACGGEWGGDATLEFVAPAAGRYRFTAVGDLSDGLLSRYDACGGTELACGYRQLVQDLGGGELVELVVDGGVDGVGVEVEVTAVPSVERGCDDAQDQDLDGAVDCADPDCDRFAACAEGCDDGVDDDADGWVDCLDPACVTDPACAPACPGDALAGAGVVTGTTRGGADGGTGSCAAGAGAADDAIAFTAPTAGTWAFDTRGSDFAAVLWTEPACGGGEDGCAAAGHLPGDARSARLERDLAAGDEVVVHVDGATPTDQGAWTLRAYAVTGSESSCHDAVDDDLDGVADCDDADCAGQPDCVSTCPEHVLVGPGRVDGVLAGRPDLFELDCSYAPGSGFSDTTVGYTSPADARVVFSFDPAGTDDPPPTLAVLDQCSPRASQRACRPWFVDPVAVVDLSAGESVVVALEEGPYGSGGAFRLVAAEVPSVEAWCDDGRDDDADGLLDCLDDDCGTDPACLPTCPALTSTGLGRVSGDTFGLPDDHAPSCADGLASDQSIAFTAPADGRYRFDLGGAQHVLALEDSCGGHELACSAAWDQPVEVDLRAAQTLTLVVDGAFDGAAGPYDLEVTAPDAPPCPEDVLPAVLPAQVHGDTSDAAARLEGCADSSGPEHTYAFTAPAAGTYVFDARGSSYDTVVYALDGCGGARLACNDDFQGLQSRIAVPLAAGGTVVIVVDGYGGGSGPFVLTVHP